MSENSITPKQQKTIDKICSMLGIEFQGQTKQEASKFIAKYLPCYLEKKESK